MSEARALYLITLLGIGGIVGQLPIGWLADRVDRMLLASVCTLLVVGTCLTMPLVISHFPWNFLLMLFLGACLFGRDGRLGHPYCLSQSLLDSSATYPQGS